MRFGSWTRGVALGLAVLVPLTAGCRPATTDERIADTMRRTESIRGLKALEAVPYRFLAGDAAFDDVLAEWHASDAADETRAEALALGRLGLLPRGFDILSVLDWSTRTGVLGYYEPDEERITVVADEADVGPGELMVLAHEHAHALQDQHFGLQASDVPLGDEAAVALDALTEGEAMLVMAIWVMKRLGSAGLEEIEAEDIPLDVMPLDEVPPLLYRTGEFPYVDGLAFVYDIWSAGGWEAVDALWADPPVSSEQIMHPERYPHDVPELIDLPDLAPAMGPGWETAADLTLGEMRIGVLLADGRPWADAEGTDDDPFGFPRLAEHGSAEGWGGDRLIHLVGPDDDWAVAWQTTWDRARDAREFEQALRMAFTDLPNATTVEPGVDVSRTPLAHPVLVLVAPDETRLARLHERLASLR